VNDMKAKKPSGAVEAYTAFGEWAGLKTGDWVQIADMPGWQGTFLRYIHAPNPFVEVIVKRRKQVKMRYIAPGRILDRKGKQVAPTQDPSA
jgi:hypothetical protein